MNQAAWSLLIFFLLCILSYFSFKPKTGWFWLVRDRLRKNDRVVMEDILKILFHDEHDTNPVIEMKKALGITESHLNQLLETMVQSQLILKNKDSIILTQSGKEYALKIIRIHRLWETFLSEKTGFNKLEWHDRAEEMEHNLSGQEVKDLATKIGNPRFDPHGDPIPTEDGNLGVLEGVTLDLFQGHFAKIVHVEDEPESVYKAILKLGFLIGDTMKIETRRNNAIQLITDSSTLVIPNDVAKNITVAKIPIEEYREDICRLSKLIIGEKAEIIGLSKECRGINRRRLLDLGFVPNTKISIQMESPLKEPKAFLIFDTQIALRKEQTDHILIKKYGEAI